MRFLTAVALAVVMLWAPVDGVAQDRDPLKGLQEAELEVRVDWIDDFPGVNKEQFASDLERAFELGLLRAGIRLSDRPEGLIGFGSDVNVLPILTCNIGLLDYPVSDGRRMAIFNLQPILLEFVVPWKGSGALHFRSNTQFAETWAAELLGTVDVRALDGTRMGEACAENFELQWRRANN